ncbi:unnamed protein product [Clonostachys solani]|uniref:Uncharacterized protein n=1 Tax=Clonostachys solani TaxID=160281 RepID=A0A9P0ENQ4_9HYPO|nr:unnamed protein product [Clonostachys solani]
MQNGEGVVHDTVKIHPGSVERVIASWDGRWWERGEIKGIVQIMPGVHTERELDAQPLKNKGDLVIHQFHGWLGEVSELVVATGKRPPPVDQPEPSEKMCEAGSDHYQVRTSGHIRLLDSQNLDCRVVVLQRNDLRLVDGLFGILGTRVQQMFCRLKTTMKGCEGYDGMFDGCFCMTKLQDEGNPILCVLLPEYLADGSSLEVEETSALLIVDKICCRRR